MQGTWCCCGAPRGTVGAQCKLVHIARGQPALCSMQASKRTIFCFRLLTQASVSRYTLKLRKGGWAGKEENATVAGSCTKLSRGRCARVPTEMGLQAHRAGTVSAGLQSYTCMQCSMQPCPHR